MMGGKESKKERKKNEGSREKMKRMLKGKQKELSESKNILCPLLPQGLCTCDFSCLENFYPLPCFCFSSRDLFWSFLFNFPSQLRYEFLEADFGLCVPRIFAWRIPWTEEPGGLQSTGSQWVGHHWEANSFTFIAKSPDSRWSHPEL